MRTCFEKISKRSERHAQQAGSYAEKKAHVCCRNQVLIDRGRERMGLVSKATGVRAFNALALPRITTAVARPRGGFSLRPGSAIFMDDVT